MCFLPFNGFAHSKIHVNWFVFEEFSLSVLGMDAIGLVCGAFFIGLTLTNYSGSNVMQPNRSSKALWCPRSATPWKPNSPICSKRSTLRQFLGEQGELNHNQEMGFAQENNLVEDMAATFVNFPLPAVDSPM